VSITQQEVPAQHVTPAVAEAARGLARAIANSEVFRRFEVSQEHFSADKNLQQRLVDYDTRKRDAQLSGLWDAGKGNGAEDREKLWKSLLKNPVLKEYLACEAELRSLLREATTRITNEVGIDYGAACAAAGGCC
jgi:cell fate (sporulation/competence/biofilm development) regulator YlbF (YheA/YmcA/DUF963 family)